METCPCAEEYRQEATRDDIKRPTVFWLIHPAMEDRGGIRHIEGLGRV